MMRCSSSAVVESNDCGSTERERERELSHERRLFCCTRHQQTVALSIRATDSASVVQTELGNFGRSERSI
jgi:hypothetical protein